MSSIRRHSRLVLVAVSCAVIGAGASAIASAGASTSTSSRLAPERGVSAARAIGLRRLSVRAVHGELVLATAHGFVNVTFDRGQVDAVSGQQLTIAEGTRRATYKTVSLTIPTGARVRDNRHSASLSDLQAGQRVIVIQAPKQTYVIAHTPKTP